MSGAVARPPGVWRSARAVFTRPFWTFRAVNALLGALLTIGSGIAQLSVGDVIRGRIDALSAVERDSAERIRIIDAAVAEFKLFETDATLIQVLTLTDAIRPEVRDQVRALSIMNRRHAFLSILAELHPEVEAFGAQSAEYDRLSQGSIGWDKTLADAMIAMESAKIQDAHRLQQTLIARMYDAREERQALQNRLDRYTTIGATAQMAGLLMVLLGNLLADHMAARGKDRPPSSAGPAGEPDVVETEPILRTEAGPASSHRQAEPG